MGTNITGIGNANAIGFKSRVTGGIYFPPELKDALVGVWSAYGKSNDSTDRNIIKNKIKDRGGDFVISNAAFKLNSGFGGFVEDFTSWDRIDSSTAEISNDGSKIKCINTTLNVQYLFNYINRDISSFKIKISNFTKGDITYYYRKEDGIEAFFKITPLSVVNSDKVIELPKSYNTVENGTGSRGGFYSSNINIGVTIEQIPSFEGAFVTDGVNDLITSTKTVQEMLGGSNEITVVSMIHQIGLISSQSYARNNYFIQGNDFLTNTISAIGKIGIYGYKGNLSNIAIVNDILGDKKDYSVDKANPANIDSVFSVNGTHSSAQLSSVAWYWTIIANKVLTTDQINQVIAYFNLDRTLKPDILCDVKKQGITNENHAEFGDKLIDFSGNGRDIQLNNLAWKLDSGIGKYETDLSDTRIWTRSKEITSSPFSFSYNGLSGWILFANTKLTNSTDIPSFKIQIKGLLEGQELIYRYYDSNGQSNVYSMGKDGEYTLPSNVRTAKPQTSNTSGFQVVKNEANIITITQIPSHAGALCLDGVNDFGKVTGLPIYKDYTVIADYIRTFAKENVLNSPILSKSKKGDDGAFIFNYVKYSTSATLAYDTLAYSFASINNVSYINDFERNIYYQSKYTNNGNSINAGKGVDTDGMWLGTIRDNDYRFFNGAIYSLMTFPYSMSEFLIERQLKKHKLGTLYPDMVEFRPVIKANNDYEIVYTAIIKPDNWQEISIGDYVTVGKLVAIQIKLNLLLEVTNVSSNSLADVSFYKEKTGDNVYTIYGRLLDGKSPQKINITIDEYIRFEDIVQPYPVLLRFKDENGNEVSWGGKFKVGSTITRIGSAADSNLLPNIYNIFGLLLNGNQVTSSKVIVEKTMVFKAKSAYIFDNNEPKCILSPSRLRIPNSSYKLLGYIPDISGHGNHGVIHNSAYAEGSGVNEDGSYQFDGVDDFVAIPTLSSGGKQVLMKVNSRKSDCYLYDQRNNWTQYLGIVSTKDFIAYNYSNQRGKTYIDGILNENITANDLIGITHNITVTNNRNDVKQYSPCIGTSFARNSYAQMALYDFMLFDEISTDDKIKELNEYVGIEAKVELPPYYWDTYGKTNSDADRDTIQQSGIAVGDYDLTNSNFAYEGMSGYNGYPVVFGANKTWEQMPTGTFTWNIDDNKLHITKALIAGNGLLFSYIKLNGSLLNVKEIPSFKIKVSGLEGKSKLWYRYLKTEDAISETIAVLENGTHELPKSYTPSDSLRDGVWIGFTVSPISEGVKEFDCDITIEVLPEYENGLVYDGITNYSKNANIPAFDDFTAIIKREWLKKQGCPLIKGSKVYEGGNGNALLLEWDKAYNFVFYKRTDIMEGELPDNISFITPTNYNGNVITRGSEQDTNGICIAGDGNAGFANMVFYKLILYPKTIPLLQINFLKNLMEKDEIIDLNNPIFIKDE